MTFDVYGNALKTAQSEEAIFIQSKPILNEWYYKILEHIIATQVSNHQEPKGLYKIYSNNISHMMLSALLGPLPRAWHCPHFHSHLPPFSFSLYLHSPSISARSMGRNNDTIRPRLENCQTVLAHFSNL